MICWNRMEQSVLEEAHSSEVNYIANPTDDTKRSWLAAQSMLRDLSLQLAENKRFFLQQSHFDEGENTGHMLAMLSKSQQPSSLIGVVHYIQGVPCYTTKSIMDVFKLFFQDVYSSKVQPSQEDICSFLEKYPIPCLSDSDSALLSAPLTEEELLEALAHAQNSRAPGADGLPAEVYKRYASQLIPILLKVYN